MKRRKLRGLLAFLMAALLLAGGALGVSAADRQLDFGGDTLAFNFPQGDPLFDFSGMMPGDSRTATVSLTNNFRNRADVYLKADFAQALYPDQKEYALALEMADALRLTLTRQFDGDAAPVVVYDGRLSGKADSVYTGQQATVVDQFLLGALAAGSTGNLTITVSAPGAAMGNRFMGKTAKVNWLFQAQADEDVTPLPPGGGTTPERTNDGRGTDVADTVRGGGEEKPSVIIPDDGVPMAEGPGGDVSIVDGTVPLAELPKTGGCAGGKP